jgi:hypothetical protein
MSPRILRGGRATCNGAALDRTVHVCLDEKASQFQWQITIPPKTVIQI